MRLSSRIHYDVFTHSLGVNWIIVTGYVPALVVSSLLILVQLRRPAAGTVRQVRQAPPASGVTSAWSGSSVLEKWAREMGHESWR